MNSIELNFKKNLIQDLGDFSEGIIMKNGKGTRLIMNFSENSIQNLGNLGQNIKDF